MESHEAMAETIGRDVVEIARALGLKPVTVRKWKEESGPGKSGSLNPLMRLEMTIGKALALGRPRDKALRPLYWLNARFRMVGIQAPVATDLRETTNRLAVLMGEFGEFVTANAESLESGDISPDGYAAILDKGREVMLTLGQYLRILGEE